MICGREGIEMSADTSPENVNAGGQRDAESVLAGRRRLLRGGLGAAPVILTVASRPVMANGKCTTASAFGSINMSRPSKTAAWCGGSKPDTWKNCPHSDWPCVPNTTFNSCFGSGCLPNTTLLQVLQKAGSEKDEVARYCVAALLNARKRLTPDTVLSVRTLRLLWQSFLTSGYYEPTAGVRWYPHYSDPASNGGFVEWLASTMPN